MTPSNELGKMLVVIGLAVTVAGIVVWSGAGRSWLGRLPGDLHLRRGNVQVYFPLMTCLLLSALLTLLAWVFRGRR
ncbi:MAG TPA: DUF2905 domain-containing protein [Opitutaceae bacterium]|jgi:hypothetical protein|nr:DUF2905 domain-containing protein [Opitutaceae bacterium]